MPTILMFVVLMLPGQPPIKHHEIMATWMECISEVAEIVKKGIEGNISIQAGCVVQPGKQDGT